jgi:hypothetical protein
MELMGDEYGLEPDEDFVSWIVIEGRSILEFRGLPGHAELLETGAVLQVQRSPNLDFRQVGRVFRDVSQ